MRQKVRGDYEARLRGVIERLGRPRATIAKSCSGTSASQAELDRQRRQAEEELAEAEVRHTVGEYSEDEWRQISEESRRELEQLREQLRTVGTEITRLAEVQALIVSPRSGVRPRRRLQPRGSVARPAPKPEVIEQRSTATPVADPMADPAAPPARSAPSPHPSQPERAAPEVDELAFLKSVADEHAAGAPVEPPRHPVLRRARPHGAGPSRVLAQSRRARRGQDPQVRRVRHAQPPDRVVL